MEDLFEHWPANEAELAPLRARALANPLYENFLISGDATFTILMIELQPYTSLDVAEVALAGFGIEEERVPLKYLTGGEILESVLATEEILSRYDGLGFTTHLAGAPLMQQKLQERMQRDMALFVGLSLAVIGILLWILFRRPTGVLFPMGVVVLSVLSTLGAMGWAGVPLTLPTQILPSFILAAGIGAAVHILTIFYQCVARGDSREDSIAHALGHSGLAVAMTGLTTAGALASFLSAELAPVVHFGIFAPLGAILILFYSLVLMPAVIALTPIGTRVRSAGGARFLDAFLERCAQISTQHPWGVLGVSGALVVVALAGFSGLHKSHDPMVWFPETEVFRIDTAIIDEKFHGTMAVEVLITTAEENGLYEPSNFCSISTISYYINNRP